MGLSDRVLQGEIRAAAKLMRLVDDDFDTAISEMKKLYPKTGKAAIIGITGSPGAGKSSLVNQIIKRYRARGKKVGVVAIDPTSPFSGGAIMGDRVRMDKHFEDEGVFIRSLATRGHLGGLSKSTGEIIRVMEAWGADPVIVETVGVGQAEVDVVKMAQTSIVVMVPGLGDEIQAIKAGIMEIADIFIVNKSDRQGAERATNDIRMMLELVHPEDGDPWLPKIFNTVAFRDEGIDEVVEGIDEHRDWMIRNNMLAGKKKLRAELQAFGLLYDRMKTRVFDILNSSEFENWRDNMVSGGGTPYELAESLEEKLLETEE